MAPRKTARGQRGMLIIELALVLPTLLLIVAILAFYGRVMYCSLVAQKAAHDACRYMSTIEKIDMKNPGQIGHHLDIAKAIIAAEIGALGKDPYAPLVSVACDGFTCGGYSIPAKVSVGIQVMALDMLPGMTGDYTGGAMVISASASMIYAGL